ncbi:MAG: type II toxin-antitoxin system CcdA family antitoxin [Burkholderiales bacterium]|nr:type II toxin-antitoxin system CcdA family antitoxin [Burkholderiales bacterium]
MNSRIAVAPPRPPRARRKKSANLSVDAELLQEARRLDLNLSQVLESSLALAIRERKAEEWLARNRAALEAYNEHIERDGVFSDGLRSF